MTMAKIKIMLSSRPKLLSDVIRDLINRQEDMEIIGEVIDPLQLLITTKNTKVDAVIITPLKANGEPRICHQLLVEHPHLIILTVDANTNAAYLYRLNLPRLYFETPTSEILLGILRGSPFSPTVKPNGEFTK